MPFGPLVDVGWLREHAREPGVVLVDCRWRLGEPDAGARLYATGHLPGAAFLAVERDLSAPPGAGRHPLPEPDAFERAARAAGIGGETRVVAYDEAGEGGAARLWWLLRHFGHPAAAVLDGGLRAWREVGGPLAAGRQDPPPGDFRALPREGDAATAGELRRR
nr:rhodanese-like domain-containing protein [Actinomycetota bacterium]